VRWIVSLSSETVTSRKPRFFMHLSQTLSLVLQSHPKCPLIGKQETQAQIGRLLVSHALHGSDSLCKLLRYLAHYAEEHPGSSPKEYQIATEVFGRPGDFDPHQDSMVRVQVGRLRSKLADYYASEGARDTIIVDLPKGSYALTFQERPSAAASEQAHAARETAPAPTASVSSPFRLIAGFVVLSMALTAALAITVDRLLLRRVAQAHSMGENPDATASVRTFWNGFLAGDETPWVIFSNASFVGRPDSGMRYYNPKRDEKVPTLDHYTGVGEVLAVHALDTVFRQLQRELRVKRGSLFSLDDAKNNYLIFLGSPSENLTLLEIPTTRDFSFETMHCCSREGNVKIVNKHPAAGEEKEYIASPSNQPLTEDYAVIALVQGLRTSHSVLILAGTTTIGTQAAAEYVCDQNSLNELLRQLGVSSAAELKPFEGVIHTKVVRGVPVGSQLVALHKINN
jgi:hypothetical protein